MMIAVSDIREVEWFEGKSPEVFVLNSGDVYIHTTNSSMTTLTYHVTSVICMHTLQFPLLSFDTESTAAYHPAIKVL